MASPVDTIKSAILGNPLDANKKPSRQGVVKAFAEMQVQLEGASSGAFIRTTEALLNSISTAALHSMGWVTNDPNSARNGVYENTGAGWARRTGIPQFIVTGMNTGTGFPDLIKVTTDLPLPTEDGRALVSFNIIETNTGPAQVEFLDPARPPMDILTNNGNPLAAGFLTAGMVVTGFITGAGTKFRLQTSPVPDAIIAAADASRSFAKEWANKDVGQLVSTAAGGDGVDDYSAKHWAQQTAAANIDAYVISVAALKSLDTTVKSVAYLTEPGRAGVFVWRTGDYSSKINADTVNGIYIKADAILATSGAWVRDFKPPFSSRWFGAVADGVTDDRNAILVAATVMSTFFKGGELIIVGQSYVGSTFTVPRNVKLTGMGISNALEYADWLIDAPSAIVLSRAATIRLLSNAGVRNLLIYPPGMTTTQTSTQVTAWTGTAIELANFCWDHLVEGCTILGYENGVVKEGGLVSTSGINRPRIHRNNFDCKNCVIIAYAYDVPYITENHCWPYASINATAEVDNAQFLRNGAGFTVGDVCDWLKSTHNFSYGWLYGWDIVGGDQITLDQCGVDYVPEKLNNGNVAYRVRGNAQQTRFTNCQSAAAQTAFEIDAAASVGDVLIEGATVWEADYAGVSVLSGQVRILGGSFMSANTAKVGSGIIVNGARKVNIDNCSFLNLVTGIDQANTSIRVHVRGCTYDNCTTRRGAVYSPIIASASTLDVDGETKYFVVSGTVNINAIAGAAAYVGEIIVLEFQSTLTIVHSATLRLAGAVNKVVDANDVIAFVSTGTGWRQIAFTAI